jgi:hypothetical protein
MSAVHSVGFLQVSTVCSSNGPLFARIPADLQAIATVLTPRFTNEGVCIWGVLTGLESPNSL